MPRRRPGSRLIGGGGSLPNRLSLGVQEMSEAAGLRRGENCSEWEGLMIDSPAQKPGDVCQHRLRVGCEQGRDK